MADWKQKWEDLGKKLREHPKLEKGLYLLIVVLALLLYFTGRSSGKENQEKTETPMATEQAGTLEERLKNTLSSIQGAGKVEVLISYESSGEIGAGLLCQPSGEHGGWLEQYQREPAAGDGQRKRRGGAPCALSEGTCGTWRSHCGGGCV